MENPPSSKPFTLKKTETPNGTRPTLQPFVLESDHDPIPENPFQEVFFARGMFQQKLNLLNS